MPFSQKVGIQPAQHGRPTAGIFLLYAFGPFPSNHLFIAYGLTGLPLGPVAIPFLFGRLVSYTFWAFTASQVARLLAYRALEGGSFFSYYFILTQLFTILTIYLFARIDWKRLFTEKKIKLIRHGTNNAPGRRLPMLFLWLQAFRLI
jgi:hypothetical protein